MCHCVRSDFKMESIAKGSQRFEPIGLVFRRVENNIGVPWNLDIECRSTGLHCRPLKKSLSSKVFVSTVMSPVGCESRSVSCTDRYRAL